MTFTPLKDTFTVNFKTLVKVLSSKNIQDLEDNRQIFEGLPKFLDGTCPINVKPFIFSHPRSGNTLLRKIFEEVTGISTGTDALLSGYLNSALQLMGFMGEEIYDERVWVVKGHCPSRVTPRVTISTNRVIVCVRNPLDVLASHFNYLQT